MQLFNKIPNPRLLRHQLGLNQEAFWGSVGVTQSGGSRYDSGREMPKPVRELLRLVHIEQIDLSRVRRNDLEVVDYLRSTHPDLYKSLKKAISAQHRQEAAAPGY